MAGINYLKDFEMPDAEADLRAFLQLFEEHFNLNEYTISLQEWGRTQWWGSTYRIHHQR